MQILKNYSYKEAHTVALLVALFFILSLLMVAAPQVYNRVYIVDLLSYIDGFKRLGEGQIPHVDFNSPTGPLNYYGPYWLIKMGLATPLGAIRAFSLCVAAFGLATLFYLYKTRLTLTGFVLLFFYVVFTMMAQVNLGDDPRHVTSTMFYNRLGFGLVALLPFFFLKPRFECRVFDYIFLILSVTILFYLKLTFALVALGLLGVYALFVPRQFLLSLFALVVFLLLLSWISSYEGLTAAYIKDLRDTIGSSTFRIQDVFYFLLESLGLTLASIVLPLFILFYRKKLYWLDGVIAFFCWSAGLALTLSNAQWANIYLPLVFIIYINERLERRNKLILGGAIALVLFTSSNFIATTYATIKHAYSSHNPNMTYFNLGKAGRLVQYGLQNDENPLIEGSKNNSPEQISRMIKAIDTSFEYKVFRSDLPDLYLQTLPFGIRAALKFCQPQDGVMALDFANPFPSLLNRKSVGHVLFVQDERVVSDKMNIPFERFFKNATCLLEPKLPHTKRSLTYIKRNFGKQLAEKYQVKGENELWIVHRLK